MKKILFIFLIIGLLMLVGGGFLANHNYQFVQQSVSQQGSVIDLERSKSDDSYVYHPVVSFVTPDDQTIEFRSSVGSNPPSYQVGETVEVIYLPMEPHKAKINSFFSLWFVEMILAILGLVFFLIGFLPLLFMRSSAKMHKRLKETGERVLADFNQVELNSSLKVNNRSPYRIICQWKDPFAPSKVYLFYSENIWFNPEQYINSKQIPVYMDRKNPKKYYMDVSFLPEIA